MYSLRFFNFLSGSLQLPQQTNKSSNYQMMESASLSCFLLKAMAKESKSHFHFRVSGTFPYIVSVKSSNSLIVIFPSFVSNIFSSSALHRLVCQPPMWGPWVELSQNRVMCQPIFTIEWLSTLKTELCIDQYLSKLNLSKQSYVKMNNSLNVYH